MKRYYIAFFLLLTASTCMREIDTKIANSIAKDTEERAEMIVNEVPNIKDEKTRIIIGTNAAIIQENASSTKKYIKGFDPKLKEIKALKKDLMNLEAEQQKEIVRIKTKAAEEKSKMEAKTNSLFKKMQIGFFAFGFLIFIYGMYGIVSAIKYLNGLPENLCTAITGAFVMGTAGTFLFYPEKAITFLIITIILVVITCTIFVFKSSRNYNIKKKLIQQTEKIKEKMNDEDWKDLSKEFRKDEDVYREVKKIKRNL